MGQRTQKLVRIYFTSRDCQNFFNSFASLVIDLPLTAENLAQKFGPESEIGQRRQYKPLLML